MDTAEIPDKFQPVNDSNSSWHTLAITLTYIRIAVDFSECFVHLLCCKDIHTNNLIQQNVKVTPVPETRIHNYELPAKSSSIDECNLNYRELYKDCFSVNEKVFKQ